jgi:uncharacterized membrane protein YfcA
LKRIENGHMQLFLFLALLGLGIGMLSGVLGIGGGVLLLPTLTELFHLKHRQAAGMTLAVLCVPVTLPGVLQYYRQGHLENRHLVMAGCIALAFAFGTYLGGWLQNRPWVNESALRVGFGLLMIYVGVRMMMQCDSEMARATAGVTAAVLAWLGYIWLRTLGRRHLQPPELGEKMRTAASQVPPGDDYYI